MAVVGAGIIGLSIAWRCAQRGLSVSVHDTGAGNAWGVAAGMLAPVGESTFGHEHLTGLLVEGSRRWPAFAAELAALTGVDVGYRDEGTLTVALTADDVAGADRLWDHQEAAGLRLTRLAPSELRDWEPALSPRVRRGAHAPDDRQVDPRRVVAALRTLVPVTEAPPDARTTVVAAGCGTAALTGLPIRPVKGQVLRLRGDAGTLRHVIRGYADGRHVYLVPRADGEIVVGATEEERADAAVTAGGVAELLRAALDLVPELAECELAEAAVGHRPGTPDNAPVIGRLPGRADVVVASGHHRHGVLLAPITADIVADEITGTPAPEAWSPRRFA
ncbi:glycine oxidase ThiO [Spirilliplanes yamanashiensis]